MKTPREITEGSIRLARFMGVQVNPLLQSQHYNKDWNALIPVLDKIESMHNNGFDVVIGRDNTVVEMFRQSPTDELSAPVTVAQYGHPDHDYMKRIDHAFGCAVAFTEWLENRATDTDIEG